ncbi:MAG: aminopeptidase [Planctomycetota bacterium]|nr:MAG: aminopeptidase [Planctomycetota bacterium]
MTNTAHWGRAPKPAAKTAVRRRRLGAALAAISVASAVSLRADTQFAPDRPWDLMHIKVVLSVDLEARRVESEATIDLKATRPASRVELDAVELSVGGVQIRRGPGAPVDAEYATQDGRLTVELPPPATSAGETVTVIVRYAVEKPSRGLHFFAPTEGDPQIPLQVWSQGQSNYTRHWIPCFDDPSELQTTELIVTAAQGNEVVSNGRLVSRKDAPDGRVTFHWHQEKPHPSYLITLVVGQFTVAQEEWRGRPVTYYVPPGRESQVKNAFGRTLEMLDYFSARIGVDYPWDKYAQICAEQFGGGMENTSATTLGTGVLHDDRAHLDGDADDLIAHELAHQWFGDLVTCRTWSHVWLNEGFASFFEAVWAERTEGRDGYQSVLHRFREAALAGGAAAPMVDRDYRNADRMFDARVYQKAGFMLHALKARVGEETFWRAVQRYLAKYRHQAVETHEFRRVVEAEYGGSLERFFYDWTERAGHPVIDVGCRWSADDRVLILTVKQKSEGEPFEMPLEVEIEASGVPPRRSLHWLRDAEHEFRISCASGPSRVSIDPEQVVLGELKIETPRSWWAAELRTGASLSGRIRAAEALSKEATDADVAVMVEVLRTEPHPTLARALTSRLGKADTPAAREGLLAGTVAKNPRIRSACVDALGKVTADAAIVERLRKITESGDPSYRVEGAAIEAYASHKPEGASSFLAGLMTRDSHDEIIRRAVLRGLGEIADEAALDIFIEWSQRGKPSTIRREAVQALARHCAREECPSADKTRAVKHLAQYLEGESERFLGGVLSALGQIGKPAKSVLPKLKELAESGTSERIQRDARRTIERIEANPKKDARKNKKAGKKDKKKAKKEGKKKDKKKGNAAPDGAADGAAEPSSPKAPREGRRGATSPPSSGSGTTGGSVPAPGALLRAEATGVRSAA